MEGLESNAGLTDAMRIKPDEGLQGVAAEADIIAIWLTYTATAITVGFFLSPLPAVPPHSACLLATVQKARIWFFQCLYPLLFY